MTGVVTIVAGIADALLESDEFAQITKAELPSCSCAFDDEFRKCHRRAVSATIAPDPKAGEQPRSLGGNS
jgi:hypothetical protein